MPTAKLIIDAANSVAAFYGTSPYGVPRNAFQDGNLTGGVQATLLTAAWCNAVQQELVSAIEPYASGPVGLETSDPKALSEALDYSHINRGPIYSSSTTFTFASQTPTAAASTGGSMAYNNLVRSRTASRSSIASGGTADVVVMSLPSNCQALLRFTCQAVQTDALATNYHSSVRMVSARNVSGTATVQDIGSTYTFNAGITYTITFATSVSSVIMRISAPAVPAGKLHNAMGFVEMISVHNTV